MESRAIAHGLLRAGRVPAMRFGQHLTSTVALLSLAALAAGDRAAHAGGAQSGHSAPRKSTLGASYASRRSTSGSHEHVPGKSGIGKPVKSGGSSGLGASRATSKHVSSGAVAETAPVVKGKARPIKTRAEERAIKARQAARDMESLASAAETEASIARQNADRAGALATQRGQELASARAIRKAAGHALAEAKRAYETANSEALDDLESLETVKQAAKKKKGSKAFRAFISAVSFGLYAPPEDFSDLIAELSLRARDSVRAARAAADRQSDAEDAVAAADQAVTAAEKAWTAAQGQHGSATRLAEELAGKAASLRQEAVTGAATAAELEDAADAAAERYEHKIARIDQHRLQLRNASAAERNRFRRAARAFKLATFIESKPAEVSQDALAAAPEKGLFAIADGVTNSDYSGEFARALVRRWTAGAPESQAELATWLGEAQAEWDAEVRPLIAGKATAWYNRNKTWQGDAAFVGARLVRKGGRRQIHLTGIGDTVAFLVRGGRIVRSFPLERADQFSDVVQALPSVGTPLHPPVSATWDVEPGDEVFMGTDALSHWILGETEAGRDPLPALRAIGSQKGMDRFVAEARAGQLGGHGAMGVDDTALLRFVVPAGE